VKLNLFRAQTVRFNVRLLEAAQEVGQDADRIFERMKRKGADYTLLRFRIAEGLRWLRAEGLL
jgi:hypothetical protein